MKQFFEFKKLCFVFLMGLLILSSAECLAKDNAKQSKLEGYPIASEVFTTRQKTIVPDPLPPGAEKIFPYEISKYDKNGYGKWHYGPGIDSGKQLDIMPAGYTGTNVTNTKRLLKFFTISDIHITDEESPAQLIFMGYKGGISSTYSGVMLYTTHVLDAAIQTINALHKKDRFDFGISLGDTCNSSDYNELRWYIDVLDGRNINPDSGIKDDPVPGPYNDYQDEYKAAGLDKTIKFYQTMGNHDHFWIGTAPLNDYLRRHYIGEEILNLGNIITDPLGIDSRGFYVGAMDGRTIYGDIIGVGPVKDFKEPPMVLAADPNRRSILRTEWIKEYFNSSSNPKGHGFNQANVKSGFACYSFEPKSDIPVKIIVLDDTQRDDDPNVEGYGHASIDKERYDWLVKELDEGQAEGKLMIIAAHAPIGVEPPGSYVGWSSLAYVTEKNLFEKLHTYPNLILWIAGHRHVNKTTAFKSPDANHPELGFWQIETPSLRDFPQQLRTFEIVCNSDNTISIIATDVDPAIKEGSLAAISRSYAIAAQQLFNNPIGLLPTGSCNGEFIKQLTPEMQVKIKEIGKPMK